MGNIPLVSLVEGKEQRSRVRFPTALCWLTVNYVIETKQ